MMRFSVVIPLYNKEKQLSQTIQSVLGQSHVDFELIIVDDGSTDNSAAVAKKFESKKVRLIRKENGGTASARNVGIKHSKGEYICFLDADDLWKSEFLELIEELIEKFPKAGLYGTAYKFQRGEKAYHPGYHGLPEGKRVLVPNYFESVLHGEQIITASSAAVPRQVLRKVGLFNESIRNTEDQEMWNKIALKYPVAFHREVGAIYRQDSPGMKSRYVPKDEIPYAVCLQKSLDEGLVPPKKQEVVKKIIAANLIGAASLNLLAGDKKTARRFLNDPRTHDFPERRKAWKRMLNMPTPLLRISYKLRNKVLSRR